MKYILDFFNHSNLRGFSGLLIGWPKHLNNLPIAKDGSNLKEVMVFHSPLSPDIAMRSMMRFSNAFVEQ